MKEITNDPCHGINLLCPKCGHDEFYETIRMIQTLKVAVWKDADAIEAELEVIDNDYLDDELIIFCAKCSIQLLFEDNVGIILKD